MKTAARILAAALLALAGLAAYAFLIEPSWIKLTRLRIELPAAAEHLDGIKIFHLTDVHLRGRRNVRTVLRWAAEIKPDLIVVTGDVLEDAALVEESLLFFEALPARAEIYAVPGNWEHWSGVDLESWGRELAARRVKLLVNDCASSAKGLSVAGVDDPSTGRADPERAVAACTAPFRILLAHAPSVFDHPAADKASLIFAGHCHGGQVRLPFYGPLWLPRGCDERVAGLFEKNGVQMIVSAGIGTSILPVRFGARPEAVLIELAAKK